MTQDDFERARHQLSELLLRLQDQQVGADQIRELFTREVKHLASAQASSRRIELYDYAAELLETAGLGFG